MRSPARPPCSLGMSVSCGNRSWMKLISSVSVQIISPMSICETLRIATNRCEEKEVPSSPPEPPVITPKKETKKTLSKERAKESLLSTALQDAVNAFKEMRQKMRKPMTPLAVDLLVQKLQKLAPGDEQKQIAMLMQSIENGWTGVYELKTDQVRGKKTGPHTFFNYVEKPFDPEECARQSAELEKLLEEL